MRPGLLFRTFGMSLALAIASLSAQADPRWVEQLKGHDIVLLGEVHDNPHHHDNQALAVSALIPSAVVFEMLTPAQADTANMVDRNDAAAFAEAIDWSSGGWPDFSIYAPIFAATGTAKIYGAALPRADIFQAASDGAAAVFGPEAVTYGLTPLPPDQQSQREAEQMAAHCDALPPEMLPGMVEAQRLRDAAFSRSAVQALTETGGPVVVIAGNGHTRRDWGMPHNLATAVPNATVIALGQFESEPDEAQSAPFDIWVVSAPVERGDPCEAFRKNG